MPPSEVVDLCNEVGADLWLCVPYGATDACVTQLFQMIGTRLNPGQKVYVEYSNETWNFGFGNFTYCTFNGNAAGLGRAQWYALRAAAVHDLVEAVLSGLRPRQ